MSSVATADDRPVVRRGLFSRHRLVALAVAFLLGTSTAAAVTQLADDSPSTLAELAETVAAGVAGELVDGDFAGAAGLVRPDQRERLSAGALRDGWTKLVEHLGDHRSTGKPAVVGAVSLAAASEAVQATVPVVFRSGSVDLEVTIDTTGAVVGLALRDRYVEGTGRPAVPGEPAATRAAAIAGALAAGDFEAATNGFSGSLAAALPAVQAQVLWRQTLAAMGPYLRAGEAEVFNRRPDTVAVLPLRFEDGVAELQVTVAPDGTVVGLFLAPSTRRVP